MPRTDNDLEHLFGRLRHQERRIMEHKVATPYLAALEERLVKLSLPP